MPVLVPMKASVKVVRKGKRVSAGVGVPFNFTDEEVKAVNAVMPGALRAPVVEKFVVEEDEEDAEDADLDLEDEDEDEASTAKTAAAAPSAKKAPAKKSAAKKAAAADDDI